MRREAQRNVYVTDKQCLHVYDTCLFLSHLDFDSLKLIHQSYS